MITFNAKEIEHRTLLPSFFHFSNPGRVGVEPHFTHRSRCVRFTIASPFLSLLFLLFEGVGEKDKKEK